MRIIVYAIFFYCLYLFLRFLMKLYLNTTKRTKKYTKPPPANRGNKIDPDQIEDAEFEEIKNRDTSKKD